LNKIILNVALKTIAVVISIIILTLSVLTMFTPLTLADLNKKLGNNTLAASFTIIEYNRNKDINDLAEIIELSISEERYTRILKYSDLLIKHTQFEQFCNFKDNRGNNNIYASYKQFIYGWNITALYNKGQKELAFERAKSVLPSDYCQNNALQYLIIAIDNNYDKVLAQEILVYLQQISSDILAEGEGGELQEQIAARLNVDINILETIIER